MLSKHLTMALLGSALICAPAMAQTSGTGTTGTGTTGAPATTAPATGSSTTMGTGSSASGSSMTQMQPGQWRASQLEGLNVYNNNNEKIGDISEMLVDSSGKVQAVVIGVGGFLGIGERDVAIAFDDVKFVNEPRANATASTTTTGVTGAAPGTATTTTAPNATGSTTMGTTGTTAATDAKRTSPDHAMVNMTKDQLKAMPEFRYNR
jgi:sporulation protein YlmC with PRC-barrel domain